MPRAIDLALESIQASTLSIPFKIAFKHASAERAETQSLWVQCRSRDGRVGYGEGCPREYVTSESLVSAQSFVARHRDDWVAVIHDFDSLAAWVTRNAAEIDGSPAAWTAIELALLDLLGKQTGKPLEALFELPRLAGCFSYTAVIGDAADTQFAAQLANYRKAGFHDFKIKLSGDAARDRVKVQQLLDAGISPGRVRADANNLWADASEAVTHLRALNFPFCAVEEPLRAGDYDGLRRVAEDLDTQIILDESLLRSAQLDKAIDFSARCVVNLRVSKMGGLIRSLELAREICRRGLRLIVGSHVGETSVLTRAALTVAHEARACLMAQEGAFGTHLLERDVTSQPLMFGPGGVLDIDANFARKPGLGLEITSG